MLLDVEGRTVSVVLSKRNLLALLAKVDDPDSGKTIFLLGDADGYDLWVHAEPDILHYGMREPARADAPKGRSIH